MPNEPPTREPLPVPSLPIRVVLVSPRNSLNIGAAARAMANFGFTDLAVVAPYEPVWRGVRSAVGAPDLLEKAQVCDTLAEAVAACTLVLGTGTLTYRKPEQLVVSLPDLPPIIQAEVSRPGPLNSEPRASTIALIFGPEKHGLTREHLCRCHHLIEIPTDPRQPSMNLGQAVAVCLYEIATRVSPSTLPNAAAAEPGSTSADLDRLAGVIEETMLAAGYSPTGLQNANRRDFRLLLRRLAPSGSDTRRILGLFRRILHQLRVVSKKNPAAQ